MEVRREATLRALTRRRNSGQVKVITGLRQSGKSTLLRQFRESLLSGGLREDQVLLLAFNDRSSRALRDPDKLLAHLKARAADGEPMVFLLDDIHRVKDFEEVLMGLLTLPNADVYVTGGSAERLSSQVLTDFRGKREEIHLYPLSFREFVTAYPGDPQGAWADFQTYGGLPGVLSRAEPEEKMEYLKSLLSEVILPDLAQRCHLRSGEELTGLVRTLAELEGSFTNPTKLSKTFQTAKGTPLTDKTLRRYLGHLEDSYLIRRSDRYDIKASRFLNTPVKYYFEDAGLRSAALNFWQQDPDRILENLVYTDLRCRSFHVDAGVVERSQRSSSGRSRQYLNVDFVATLGDRRYYLLSALSPDSDPQRRPLRSIDDSFRKIVLVKDDLPPRRDPSGLVTVGVRHFLLAPSVRDL